MNPCGSPNAFFAAPVRKNAGEAKRLKAVDGRLTLTPSNSPCSADSCAADPPVPAIFLRDADWPDEVPGRDCGLEVMDGRAEGEEGALLAAKDTC
jgi:hypothetical protein